MKNAAFLWKTILILALAALLAVPACAAEAGSNMNYSVAEENAARFGVLLIALARAYEDPAADQTIIESLLEAIEAVSASDGAVARAISEHWSRVYLNSEGEYRLFMHHGEAQAAQLSQTPLRDSPAHAFVVLGYELKDGEMTDELKGRCEAAAAAARAYPSALVVCSGGATGENNPNGHTEAGLMKAYLTEACGLDPARIHIDERAMTTAENALNTFQILREQGVETMTIVTSGYHQRWGQAVYNAVGALCRQLYGYSVEIVGNYCFDIETPERFRTDDRFAIYQIASILRLPRDVSLAVMSAF